MEKNRAKRLGTFKTEMALSSGLQMAMAEIRSPEALQKVSFVLL